MSVREELKNISWDFFSKLLITVSVFFQIIKWPIAPRFKDIYYHLLTAWGMVQAGGYSSWDFMQYAPVGRIHIYPPFFHILLSYFLRIGISPSILAKLFETIIPIFFIIVLWSFSKKYFGSRFAFFVLLMLYSSFNFYLSLSEHLPATLALTIGMLALWQFLGKRIFRASLLLILSFYTHIGVSWFIIFTIIIFGLFNTERLKDAIKVFVFSLFFAAPILFNQLLAVKSLSALGFMLSENNYIQFKVFDYLLAGIGIFLLRKHDTAYKLFLCLLIASLIFLLYPYRFFCAEGYLPIIFLAAVVLSAISNRKQLIAILVLILLISPSVSPYKAMGEPRRIIKLGDSAFLGTLLFKENSIWYPAEYLRASSMVKKSSNPEDIVYSSLDLAGVIIAAISGRPTANALLPELKPEKPFDPIAVSKVVIFNAADEKEVVEKAEANYGLKEIGRTKAFLLYNNPGKSARPVDQKASVPFWVITVIVCMWVALYLCRKY